MLVEDTTAATAVAVMPGSLLAASAIRLWCSRCEGKGSVEPGPLPEIALELPPGLLTTPLCGAGSACPCPGWWKAVAC